MILSGSPWQRTPEYADQQARHESRFYFRIHIFLFVAGVFFFLTTIGWLLWRLSVGGLFEMALVPLVGLVLTSMLVVAGRCLFIIALDGPLKERRFPTRNVARLEREPVTASSFLVSRSADIGPLTRRNHEG